MEQTENIHTKPLQKHFKVITNFLFKRLKPFLNTNPPSDIALEVTYESSTSRVKTVLYLPNKEKIFVFVPCPLPAEILTDEQYAFCLDNTLPVKIWNMMHLRLLLKGLQTI